MDSSNVTGFDAAVIAVLSITVVAVVIMFLLLMSLTSKVSSKTDSNMDATMRFKANLDGDSKIAVTEKRVKTQLGVVAFTNKKSDEEINDVDADIVINNIEPTVNFSDVDVTGSFLVVNNTNRDLTVERLAFYPGVTGSTVADARGIETHFSHTRLPKGQETVCDYAIRLSNNADVKLNGDITLTQSKVSDAAE